MIFQNAMRITEDYDSGQQGLIFRNQLGRDMLTMSEDGSVDVKGKLKENGADIMPKGSIIMWSGAELPDGWVLADGGVYTRSDGSQFKTPNLSNNFVLEGTAEEQQYYSLVYIMKS